MKTNILADFQICISIPLILPLRTKQETKENRKIAYDIQRLILEPRRISGFLVEFLISGFPIFLKLHIYLKKINFLQMFKSIL